MEIQKDENLESIESLKRKVLSWFNKLFILFKEKVWTTSSIKSLERWLFDWNDFFFYDYFDKTHDQAREESWLKNSVWITKLNLYDWSSILFTTNFEKSLRWKWIYFLDLLKENMNPNLHSYLDWYLIEVHNNERELFALKKKTRNTESELNDLLK